MKSRKSEDKERKIKYNWFISAIFTMVLVSCVFVFWSATFAGEKWAGVDEAVVEKIAKEHGREKQEPLINIDQGDLLLFVFLIAGTVGGFAAGYYWRILMVERAPNINKEKS